MPLAAEDTEVMHTRTRRALEVGYSARRASSGHDLAHGAAPLTSGAAVTLRVVVIDVGAP
jgi:hypothetical protein